jgi:DNA polymerase-4
LFYNTDMRVTCIHIPHYYVEVARLADEALKGLPLVIKGPPHRKACVVDCSEEAARRGIRANLPLKDACHVYPEAMFLEYDQEKYSHAWEEVLYVLKGFTYRIETKEPGTAWLDIEKGLRFFRDEGHMVSGIIRSIFSSTLLQAKAGVGNSRFIARVAASTAGRDLCIIPPGQERCFLAPLAVASLPVSDTVKQRLGLLGIKTIKKMASFSRETLINQFGPGGRLFWDIALGKEDECPILPLVAGTHLEKEAVFDVPLETMIQLKPPLEDALEEISRELLRTGRRCSRVKLLLSLESKASMQRSVIMHTPTAQKEAILGRMLSLLAGMVIESPIAGLTVSACDLSPRETIQDTLFGKKTSSAVNSLGSARAFLKAKYGSVPLMRVVEKDAQAWLPERRFTFQEL